MICALDNNNLDLARLTLNTMTENARKAPTTTYLAFKIGLRGGDAELGKGTLITLLDVLL